MRVPRPSHATVVAYVALFFAMSGTAYAATGGTFLLGKSNSATTTTSLTNSAGTALKLTSKSGYPPLSVGTNKLLVPYLNSDLLDGLSSASFLRSTAKAADANLLDGVDSTGFLRTTGKASDSDKLDGIDSANFITRYEKAWDTYMFEGHNSSYFQKATNAVCTSGKYLDSFFSDGTYSCSPFPKSLSGGYVLVKSAIGSYCPDGSSASGTYYMNDAYGASIAFTLCLIS
jgi:hypothetical protein